tara:strand:+ start:847 stop:1014 length:168 start_codon:yes stop_codon:yes gene_type:complete
LLLKNLSKLFLFIPLILYFGKRSLIAYDEGFYALQAKWILEIIIGLLHYGGETFR